MKRMHENTPIFRGNLQSQERERGQRGDQLEAIQDKSAADETALAGRLATWQLQHAAALGPL